MPKNVQNTGFAAIDAAIAASAKADNNHTLKGQDWNNVAPRLGFAWTPDADDKMGRSRRLRHLLRPSVGRVHQHGVQQLPVPARAGSHVPGRAVPMNAAWSQQDPKFPFNQYLPNRIVRTARRRPAPTRSATARTSRAGADGTPNPTDPATGRRCWATSRRRSSSAPSTATCARRTIQQYNFGVQRELGRESDGGSPLRRQQGHRAARGRAPSTRGTTSTPPDTPDHIFERFNQAYMAAGSPNGALNAGATARERGVGRAFGFAELRARRHASTTTWRTRRRGHRVRGANADPRLQRAEAVLLGNTGRSLYNSLQFEPR